MEGEIQDKMVKLVKSCRKIESTSIDPQSWILAPTCSFSIGGTNSQKAVQIFFKSIALYYLFPINTSNTTHF